MDFVAQGPRVLVLLDVLAGSAERPAGPGAKPPPGGLPRRCLSRVVAASSSSGALLRGFGHRSQDGAGGLQWKGPRRVLEEGIHLFAPTESVCPSTRRAPLDCPHLFRSQSSDATSRAAWDVEDSAS